MNKELKQVKVCLGRFQPFTLGHLKLATYSDLNGPDKEQSDYLRETPDLKEISSQKSIILVVSTPKEKVDSRHPFDDELMKKEFDLIKKKYSDKIEDIFYVKSADICAWGELLKSKGYCASVWLTGTDEFTFYKGMAMKVPEYEEKNRDNRDCKDAYTKSFYVEEIKRDENSTDFIETISGTKVRESLRNDDKELFKKMMPDGVDSLFDEFKEALLNAPEPKPKRAKKVKESKIIEYINSKYIKNLNSYITEKLTINKDTKISPITDQLSNIIKDFCQNTLKLDTLDYMSHCEDAGGNSVHDKPEKLARIYLYSKKFKDIDDTAKKLEKLLSKVKKVKKTEVFVTAIYFYFE